jgi:uncharacterized protein YjlB
MSAEATPSDPETFHFADDGRIPNSPLPLLVYRKAVPADPAAIERRFAAHGWSGGWRNGIYPFHHFHSTAHEVLGIARGAAEVRFGGPDGRTLRVEAGDVVMIPAGVAHRNVGDSGDLLVVGAYPGGAEYDLKRGDPAEHDTAARNVARVPLPAQDPVYGSGGSLLRLWRTD